MLNKAILIGNVGNDPETRHLNNTSVTSFSLATSESYKNKEGEKVSTTEWHNIVVWGNLSKLVEKYVSKGSQLYIEGAIKYESYEDKEGVKKYVTKIKADTVKFLNTKSNSQGTARNETANTTNQPVNTQNNDPLPEGDEDLPF